MYASSSWTSLLKEKQSSPLKEETTPDDKRLYPEKHFLFFSSTGESAVSLLNLPKDPTQDSKHGDKSFSDTFLSLSLSALLLLYLLPPSARSFILRRDNAWNRGEGLSELRRNLYIAPSWLNRPAPSCLPPHRWRRLTHRGRLLPRQLFRSRYSYLTLDSSGRGKKLVLYLAIVRAVCSQILFPHPPFLFFHTPCISK